MTILIAEVMKTGLCANLLALWVLNRNTLPSLLWKWGGWPLSQNSGIARQDRGQVGPRTPAPLPTPLPDEFQQGWGACRCPWATLLSSPPTLWVLAGTCEATSHEIPSSPSARRKRLYLSLDINQLLADEGIDSNMLMPRHPDPQNPQTIEQGHDPLFPVYLPLKVSLVSTEGWWSGVEAQRSPAFTLPHPLVYPVHLAPLGVSSLSPPSARFFQVFDNEEFDCRTPSEWINMGLEPGSQVRKPVPGKALLPTDDILGHGEQGQWGWEGRLPVCSIPDGQQSGHGLLGCPGGWGPWEVRAHPL